MNKPKISAIVPIYNVEKYLPKCIESIQNQTLKDIEIILVDDGTQDKSGLIADEYAQADERIKIIHKTNGGLSSARNEGQLLAQGEYISFIDSDDWVEPTMLESMYNATFEFNADIVVAGVIVDYPLEKRCVVNNSNDIIKIQEHSQIGPLFWLLYKNRLSNYAWNKIYKRSLLKDNNLKFIEDAMPAEDLFFNLTAFSKSESIFVINQAYYHYIRREEASILSNYQKNLLQVEKQRKDEFEIFFKHFKMEGKEYSIFLDRLIVDSSANIIINLYKRNAPFNREDKIDIIAKNIFNNDVLASKISSYTPQNTYEKVFIFFYKLRNPVVMEFGYSVLFFLRRKFVKIYLKFRKNELN